MQVCALVGQSLCLTNRQKQLTQRSLRLLPRSFRRQVWASSSSSSSSFSCSSTSSSISTTSTSAASSSPLLAENRSNYEMSSVKQTLEKQFETALQQCFPNIRAKDGGPVRAIVAPCNNPQHGDYQCNNAMGIFKLGRGSPDIAEKNIKSPQDVAKAIIEALGDSDVVGELSVAGPGFINVRLKTSWLEQQVEYIAKDSDLMAGSTLKLDLHSALPNLKRVIVDFSSPNIAKEMHVGHLRSTIIGHTFCKMLEWAGVDYLPLNHVGDWGTQFGMLLENIKDTGGFDLDKVSTADLMDLYKASKKRFDEDDEFRSRAHQAVVELQGGDPVRKADWEKLCEISRQDFNKIYNRLGVVIQERGESFYNSIIPDVIRLLEEKNLVEDSEGARVIFSKKFPKAPPLIVVKSDGGYNYASTDLASIWHRIHVEKAQWLIYVTDAAFEQFCLYIEAGQRNHFDMIFETADRMGWLEKIRVDHVGFGLVLGEDGKRFRTRSTEVVRLAELLDEARDRCAEQLKDRSASLDTAEENSLSDEEIFGAAEAMGYGAVKYADLKNNLTTNYKFSFDQMLDLKGDTAIYLMYAYARISAIIERKAAPQMEAAMHGGNTGFGA